MPKTQDTTQKIQDRPDTHLIANMLCICHEVTRIVNHLQAVAVPVQTKLKRLSGHDEKIAANPKMWILMWIKVTRERLDKIEQLVAVVWQDKAEEERDETECD